MPDDGGQIKNDSPAATHKCMKRFDLQTARISLFLIPLCSDDSFLFVILFFFSLKRRA